MFIVGLICVHGSRSSASNTLVSTIPAKDPMSSSSISTVAHTSTSFTLTKGYLFFDSLSLANNVSHNEFFKQIDKDVVEGVSCLWMAACFFLKPASRNPI